jgi:F-type H+-transporting ATPase subunit delta
MRITKQSRRDGKQLFRSCMVSGQLDEGRARQIVQQVLAQKPRGYLPTLTHFLRLVKLQVELRTARIESATALPQDLQQGISNNLERIYGKGLAMSFAQNTALIGGLRVRVGSDVYDGTVRARLDALEQSF